MTDKTAWLREHIKALPDGDPLRDHFAELLSGLDAQHAEHTEREAALRGEIEQLTANLAAARGETDKLRSVAGSVSPDEPDHAEIKAEIHKRKKHKRDAED